MTNKFFNAPNSTQTKSPIRSKPAKNDLRTWQSLVAPNVTKIMPKKQLMQLTITQASEALRIAQDCFTIIDKTTKPETFFMRLDMLEDKTRELSKLEPYLAGSNPHLSSALYSLKDFNDRKDEVIDSFVDKYFASVCAKASALKTDAAKIKRFQAFYDSLTPYFDEISNKNVAHIKDKYNSVVTHSTQINQSAIPSGQIQPIKEPIKAVGGLAETLDIHPDIAPLLWIGSGPFQNYTKKSDSGSTIQSNGYTIHVSFMDIDEPSLLYPEQEIIMPDGNHYINRPPYYPNYSELTPEQKGFYWQFLKDPYNPKNDIGYVFIFYYGLERHLVEGKSNEAFNIILKLRDIYSNGSFQSYSACALMLFCMAEKRIDLAHKFINSLDKDYELKIPANFYTFFKYATGVPLTSLDVMSNHKAFGFTNNRYIKNNTDLFLEQLTLNVEQTYGSNQINLSLFFDKVDFSRFPTQAECGFANISIKNREIALPAVIEHPEFKESMFGILNKTHEDVKRILAEKRKASNKVKNTPKAVNDPTVEIRKYKGLLDDGIITQEEFETKKKELLRM